VSWTPITTPVVVWRRSGTTLDPPWYHRNAVEGPYLSCSETSSSSHSSTVNRILHHLDVLAYPIRRECMGLGSPNLSFAGGRRHFIVFRFPPVLAVNHSPWPEWCFSGILRSPLTKKVWLFLRISASPGAGALDARETGSRIRSGLPCDDSAGEGLSFQSGCPMPWRAVSAPRLRFVKSLFDLQTSGRGV
jgi:hypothetical protein